MTDKAGGNHQMAGSNSRMGHKKTYYDAKTKTHVNMTYWKYPHNYGTGCTHCKWELMNLESLIHQFDEAHTNPDLMELLTYW
jgi:hypothetical protein